MNKEKGDVDKITLWREQGRDAREEKIIER